MNFFNLFKNKKTEIKSIINQETLKREIVVSVYKENIDWLIERREKYWTDEKITAYCKSDRNDFLFAEILPNIGRESHTYTHHILKNYDNLAEFTTFVQGSPHYHFHKNDNPNLDFFYFKEKPIHDYNPLGDFAITDCFGRPFSHWDVDLFPIWDRLFDGNIPHRFFANFGAQFIVSRAIIKNRSVEFWQEVLNLHYEYEYMPWALEIMWFYIFDPRYKSKI